MDRPLLERYAKLIVEVGANIQRGQQVIVIAAPASAPLVRAVAAECYTRGARFVDPWYFDPYVKRIRALEADPDTLEFVPRWYPRRLLDVGAAHGSRISISPNAPPGLMDGVDPAVAGRDQLPVPARALRRDQREDDELVRRPLGNRDLGDSRPS